MTPTEIQIACCKELGREYVESEWCEQTGTLWLRCKELIEFAKKNGWLFYLENCASEYWKALFICFDSQFEGRTISPELAICKAFLMWRGKWKE